MENKPAQNPVIPRFSVLGGIGAILVYLLSSLPYVLVVALIKVSQQNTESSVTIDVQMQETLESITKDSWVIVGALIIQCISLFFYAWILSYVRGTKNPFNDFGIRFTKSCLWFLPVGVGLQIAGIVLSIPLQILNKESSEQGVVTTFRESSGLAFGLILVLVAFIVPIAEEVCFRGIFQRGLSKKVSPLIALLISGCFFAAIHLFDPGAFLGATTLFIVGIFAAALTTYRGRIDASICLHIGFNLTTALFLLILR